MSATRAPVWEDADNLLGRPVASPSHRHLNATAGRWAFAKFLLSFNSQAAWSFPSSWSDSSSSIATLASARPDILGRGHGRVQSTPQMYKTSSKFAEFKKFAKQRAKSGIYEKDGVLYEWKNSRKEEDWDQVWDAVREGKDAQFMAATNYLVHQQQVDAEKKKLLEHKRSEKVKIAKDMEALVPDHNVANMTAVEMKKIMKSLGLKVSQRKADMMEQIRAMQQRKVLGLPILDEYVLSDGEKSWYMLGTRKGSENTVVRDIMERRIQDGLDEWVDVAWNPIPEDPQVPKHEHPFPGFIFIRMSLDPVVHEYLMEMKLVKNFWGSNDKAQAKFANREAKDKGFTMPKVFPDEEFDQIYMMTRKDPTKPYAKIYTARGEASAREVEPEPKTEPELMPEPVAAAEESLIEAGDVVEVVHGPFMGQRGPVVSLGSKKDLVVTLPVMGRETPVTMPVLHCKRAD